ncbi:MAG TPA: MotA/TolQ/ExbB proton channel family protein [Bacillota bacterium]|nr:MotA/TolQ/ExbB proton channel family protein [Bacillota bacterium]
MFSDTLKEVLRAVASVMQVPVMIVLLLLMVVTVIMLGSIVMEYFTERRRMKAKIPSLVDEIQGKNTDELKTLVEESGLLKRQKAALLKVVERKNLSDDTKDALARQIIFQEQAYYEKVSKITDVIARIAPIFGLLGTLIPLGPGLIALGQGDTKTLAASLLIAFDTTIAGLISAAFAYLISSIRKRWHEEYIVALETIMETILEQQSEERGER